MVTYEAFAFASLEAAEAPKAQPHTKVWGALWSAFQYTPTVRAQGVITDMVNTKDLE